MTTETNFYQQTDAIINHRASTKVKMKQLLQVLMDFDAYAKENQVTSFADAALSKGEELKTNIHTLYQDFHYSYPSVDVVVAHHNILEALRLQFTDDGDAWFFPFTAVLQGYAYNHDVENIDSLKQHLLSIYKKQSLAIYHAIFSGLKISCDQALLKQYYQEVVNVEPTSSDEIKHLEAIHEIYESLIWKHRA